VRERCRRPCVADLECPERTICFRGYCEAGDLRPEADGAAAGDAVPGDAASGGACGNGTIEPGEVCDGSDLGAQPDCTAAGYGAGGAVSCLSTCTSWDLSACGAPGGSCGNGRAQGAEQCDGVDLAGASCASLGFRGGALLCNTNCSLDPRGCG
jgi:hypothetical protein